MTRQPPSPLQVVARGEIGAHVNLDNYRRARHRWSLYGRIDRRSFYLYDALYYRTRWDALARVLEDTEVPNG